MSEEQFNNTYSTKLYDLLYDVVDGVIDGLLPGDVSRTFY